MTGGTKTSNPVLDVSVSFGRFENDSLSWEKWSAFSPNKYLEEVEKCATPGSVAQKKAYFEAHYKKIAARKAELLEQERLAQSESNETRDLNCLGLSQNHLPKEEENQVEQEEEKVNVTEVVQSLVAEVTNKQEEISLSDSISIVNDPKEEVEEEEEEEEVVVSEKCQSKVDTSLVVSKNESSELEDDFVPKEVEPKLEKEEPLESFESKLVCDSKIEEETSKSESQEESKKVVVTLENKERNVSKSKKKPTSPNPMTKTPKNNTIRRVINSTPTSVPSRVSVTSSIRQSSSKKFNTPPLPRNKSTSAGESKKVGPKSLHVSLLGTNSNSPSQPKTNRSSLIMEKMGDKDIVKRAFSAFRGNFSQVRSLDERSPLQKQVSSKRTEPKVSSSMTMPSKVNGGSLRTDRLDKRSVKTPPASFGFKSSFTKKSDQNSNMTIAEKTRFQTRSKEAKEIEIKKLSQSLNFKATPLPAFYRGKKTSKTTLDKMPTKIETRR